MNGYFKENSLLFTPRSGTVKSVASQLKLILLSEYEATYSIASPLGRNATSEIILLSVYCYLSISLYRREALRESNFLAIDHVTLMTQPGLQPRQDSGSRGTGTTTRRGRSEGRRQKGDVSIFKSFASLVLIKSTAVPAFPFRFNPRF